MKHAIHSLFFIIVALVSFSVSAQNFDETALVYRLSQPETAQLFSGTALEIPVEPDRNYRNSPQAKAISEISKRLMFESKSSPSRFSLYRERTLDTLAEHLSPEDQARFKQNFIKVYADQQAWKPVVNRILKVWISEPLTDEMRPDLYAGIEDASDQYLKIVNAWVAEYLKPDADVRVLARKRDMDLRRRIQRSSEARTFFENLRNLVDQGKIDADPAI